ncbi:MAG: hypothetical protein RDU25_05960 [Patescibacteria group bacterium]|nr:hypothetical protein [Patescibacteria group bacterium]
MILLQYFLMAWLAFLLIFMVMSLLTVMQMVRFGISGMGTYASTFLFLILSIGTILACSTYFLTVDWSMSVDLFGGLQDSIYFNP